MQPNSYNTQAIEMLLRRSFTPLKFVLFCYDYYPQVYQRWHVHTTPDDRVEQLLAYCMVRQRMGELLQQLKRLAPDHYSQDADYVHLAPTPPAPTNITQSGKGKYVIQAGTGTVTINIKE